MKTFLRSMQLLSELMMVLLVLFFVAQWVVKLSSLGTEAEIRNARQPNRVFLKLYSKEAAR